MKRKRYEWKAIVGRVKRDLSGADLSGADLSGADLFEANLRGADLRGADLSGATLRGTKLYRADLRGANLSGADLQGADLRGTDLRDCVMNWQSHDLIAERLRQEAGNDTVKRLAADYVAITTQWCWGALIANAPHVVLDDGTTLLQWTMVTMQGWIKEGDGAPNILKNYTP